MAYTPPARDAVDFDLVGGYTPPARDAIDFDLTETALIPEGNMQAVTGATAQFSGTAGTIPVGALAGSTDSTAAVAAQTFEPYGADLLGATEDSGASVNAVHGVSGTLSDTTDSSAAATADHGVAAQLAATTEARAAVAAISSIYSLSGQVKDGDGQVLSRRVRAYDRASGALVGEADSDAAQNGYWDMVCVGFSPAECYVVALDLDSEATDFAPPVVNRIASVLRYD